MKEPWCVLLFSICKSMFAYSRLWGGWAAEEAETAGWRPPGSASSPSTASWTDPSWLRPLASWMTLGSGSDTSQVGRSRCEKRTPKRTSQTTSRCTALAARTPAPVRWAPQLWLLTLVSKSWLRRVRLWCHALHPRAQSSLSSTFCRPSCSSLGDLMPTVTSGEAADNFMSREGIC